MKFLQSLSCASLMSLAISTLSAQSCLITNVTAHLGTGKVIENAVVGFSGTKFTVVGSAADVRSDTFRHIIDGKGRHLYPGFIAPNTKLGLEEIESVRATLDYSEVGVYNPHVRALIAYNTDSDIIPTVRSNGVLLTQIAPQGGVISGASSVMTLESAANWEERAYLADDGLHLRWPSRFTQTGWWAEQGEIKRSDNYGEKLNALKAYFAAASAYVNKPEDKSAARNLRFEAMRPVFAGKANLYIHTDDAKSILEAIQFCKEFKISRRAIIGGADAWFVADALREAQMPVILKETHALPLREDADIDQPYKTPKILQDKGVLFGLSMEGSWQNRNVIFQAGQAAAYGLEREAAIAAVTLNTAKILGVAERTGSIEVGKDANFIITAGDVLDMKTSNVEVAYIRGAEISLRDKQKDLFDFYLAKYKMR